MSSFSDAPQLGATFAPGGDEYYGVPVVLTDTMSPLTPVEDNGAFLMAQNQIHEGMPALDIRSHGHHQYTDTISTLDDPYMPSPQRPPPPIESTFPPRASTYVLYEEPQVSQPTSHVFPDLLDRPPNVPPSAQEQEEILESARLAVLQSPDPETQLTWAFDTLAHVESAAEDERRMARAQPGRAVAPPIQRQLRLDAVNIVSFLADQEHPRADYMRGMWVEFGKFGHTQNKSQAFKAYKRAAGKSYARAEYRMGMQFESTNEYAKAVKHYRLGEAQGDAACCYRMAMVALLGQLGQAQDFDRGIRLIRYAADNADENAPQGAYVFGMLLTQDLPQVKVPEAYLPYDLDNGRMYIEKAAFLGFHKAQLKMGAAYELCSLGCDFNPALSLHYNVLASRQGEAEAELAISKWYLCGYEGLFERDDRIAYEYAQRAALAGLSMAEFALGYFHEIGVHVLVDLEMAREWYSKAAKRGNKDAIARLAEVSVYRTLSKNEHEDIAISRIRSQHGSKRGGRPERFRRASSVMPTIPDDAAVHMADAQILTRPGYARVISPIPERSLSSAPCQLENYIPGAVPYLPEDVVLDTTAASNPVERRATPLQFDGRPNTPANNHIVDNLRTETPPPRTATPPLYPHASPAATIGTTRSLSPTRKPVPNRTMTPISRATSPAPPPKLELSFRSPLGPIENVSDRRLSYQLTETVKPQAEPTKAAKKGPQSFEEMGVPMAKQEQDCIVM